MVQEMKKFFDSVNVYGCNNGISDIHGNWFGESFMEISFINWWRKTHEGLRLSVSVLCLGKFLQNLESNDAWERKLGWIKFSQNYGYFDRIGEEPTEFEWNIFPVKGWLYKLGKTQKITERIQFMSMFNVISCGTRDNEQECLENARLVSLCARKFGKGQWSFSEPDSEKKWYCVKKDSQQGSLDNTAEKMLMEFVSGCPIFRATTPLSRGSLRDSRRDVWRIRIPPRKKGAFCCDGTINRAQCGSFIGEWWPSISKFSIPKIWKANWKASTTRWIE